MKKPEISLCQFKTEFRPRIGHVDDIASYPERPAGSGRKIPAVKCFNQAGIRFSFNLVILVLGVTSQFRPLFSMFLNILKTTNINTPITFLCQKAIGKLNFLQHRIVWPLFSPIHFLQDFFTGEINYFQKIGSFSVFCMRKRETLFTRLELLF